MGENPSVFSAYVGMRFFLKRVCEVWGVRCVLGGVVAFIRGSIPLSVVFNYKEL